MDIYGELDLMPEHKIQYYFKSKPEHIAKVNMMPNLGKYTVFLTLQVEHY